MKRKVSEQTLCAIYAMFAIATVAVGLAVLWTLGY